MGDAQEFDSDRRSLGVHREMTADRQQCDIRVPQFLDQTHVPEQGRVAGMVDPGPVLELDNEPDRLAEVQLDDVPLAKSLERLFLDRQRNTHNVLITPYLDSDAARRIRILLERGTSVLLVLLLWEDTNTAMIHRAGGLGCNVVELRPGVSFDRTFARMVGAGRR